MLSYIKFVVDVCLFRRGPQDAPASQQFLLFAVILATLSNFLLDSAHENIGTRAMFAFAQVAMLGLAIWVVLAVGNRLPRWPQTSATLYGASALINLVAWPFFTLSKADKGDSSTITAAAAMFITVWFVAVMARSLHHALEVRPAMAFLITFACLLVSGMVLLSLFPLKPA